MFKKALQVATAFGVLLAAYAGYVHVFALVARAVSLSGPSIARLVPAPSRTHLKAIKLAERAWGPNHWAASKDLPIRIYNHDRGFWMYARDYVRHKDGKHVDFFPFAIIWVSADGRALKTATSDYARIELDQPFNIAPSKVKASAGSSLRVVHARLEGDVNLRDDKGTPANPADDLRIGPLSWIDYDEKALQINSDSDVVMQDDVYRVDGTGLLIKLRPKDDGQEHPAGTPTGFQDAQTAYLFRNVHIVISDVGAGGILPGTSAGASSTSKAPGGPNPLDLRCDGLMQVDFPRRTTAVEVGPPEPKGPTVAQFSRNVEVLRGKPGPYRDQLNADHLRLTLVPPDGPPAGADAIPADAPLSLDPAVANGPDLDSGSAPDPTAPSPAAKGPMTNLALREAVASGHNVRLVSAAQDVKVRCNELIYKKQPPARPGRPADNAPDTTYFRGDRTTGLIVEKIDRAADGPTKGQVTTFTTIRAIDATIFDDHRGNDHAVIVASGPGEMETRPGPGLNGPIERTAHWSDLLTIRPVAGPTTAATTTTAATPAPVRKRITLTGKPGFVDIPAKATLDGRQKQSTIDIWLRPKPAPQPANTATASAPASPGSGSYEIEHLVASKDVLLVTPGKTLTARNDLQAAFVPQDPDVIPAAGPAPAAKPAAPVAPPAPSTGPAAPAPAPTTAPGTPAAPAKPAEPQAKAIADRVWARVFLKQPAPAGAAAKEAATAPAGNGLLGGGGPNGSRKAEIDEVRLRGSVAIHQDPSPGKARGTEIAGEAVDLFNQGGKGSQFIVYSDDPTPHPEPAARAPGVVRPQDDDQFKPLAMVDSDEMVIRGHRIGLDQATDRAWVDGNGSLTQLAARGLLSDKGLGDPPAPEVKARPATVKPASVKGAKDNGTADPAPAPAKKATGPMTVYFGDRMRFYGKSTDPTGKAVARAEFYKDVHAETDEATLDCKKVMYTYFDRTIKLARPATQKPSQDASAEPAPPEPKAEIALIECVEEVVVVNTKRDPETKAITQKQKIVGNALTYDKLTGRFHVPGRFDVPGEGVVSLYELEGKSSTLTPNPAGAAPATPASGRVIRPMAGPGRGQPAPVRRGAGDDSDVVGRTDPRDPTDVRDGRPSSSKKARKPAPKPLPMMLTTVHFTEKMQGRFGTGLETDKTGDRRADFYGDVEAIRARVAGPDATLDPERPPVDAMTLTSRILRVVSEPPSSGAVAKDPKAPPRYLLRAWENAYAATSDTTIQADIITYDSQSSNLYAYGEEGRDVVIAQQNHVGQNASVAPGRTLQYNLKTGQSTLADPKSFAFIDAKTGYRPGDAKPPTDKDKPRIAPRKKFRNPTNNVERKGFTGT